MDLTFLKRIKTKNTLIIQQLEEGINQCDLIMTDINETLPYTCQSVDLTNFYHKRKTQLKEETHELKVIQHNVDKEIYKLCKHDFTKDFIETILEETVSVEYCLNCELNKETQI